MQRTLEGLKAMTRWVHENRGAAVVGGIVLATLGSAAYGGLAIYNAKYEVAESASSAKRLCLDGRVSYTSGDVATATKHVMSARKFAEKAIDQVETLSIPTRFIVLRLAGVTRTHLYHLAAHANYHCAVLCIRNQKFDKALRYLEKSIFFRSKTRVGEEKRSGDVTKLYKSVIDDDEIGEDFFTVLAYYNFGILWYSLGYDNSAVESFKRASSIAEKLSKSDEVRSLDAGNAEPKNILRKRVAACVNVLQVLTTTSPRPSPHVTAEALSLLNESTPEKVSCVVLGVRVSYGIIAGLTSLIESGSFLPDDEKEAHLLVERAIKLGKHCLPFASARHQGIFEYHHAAYLLLKGDSSKASLQINMATVNHGHHRSTERDVRLYKQDLNLQNASKQSKESTVTIGHHVIQGLSRTLSALETTLEADTRVSSGAH